MYTYYINETKMAKSCVFSSYMRKKWCAQTSILSMLLKWCSLPAKFAISSKSWPQHACKVANLGSRATTMSSRTTPKMASCTRLRNSAAVNPRKAARWPQGGSARTPLRVLQEYATQTEDPSLKKTETLNVTQTRPPVA